jgi:hypothetical protein
VKTRAATKTPIALVRHRKVYKTATGNSTPDKGK